LIYLDFEQTAKTCGSEPAREGGGTFNIVIA
jgi:hypothetical protein